jgi:FKBP-type peptidyl-prolyl cis-trans isomerase
VGEGREACLTLALNPPMDNNPERMTRRYVLITTLAVVLAACGGSASTASPTVTQRPTPALVILPDVTGTIVTTNSGLQYIDLKQGSGKSPGPNDQVKIWYTLWLQSSKAKIDSSVDRGQPAVFSLSGVIPGFAEGLLTMQEGGRRRLIVPPELGYGATGTSSVPPNSVLVFDVELLQVLPPPSPQVSSPAASQGG